MDHQSALDCDANIQRYVQKQTTEDDNLDGTNYRFSTHDWLPYQIYQQLSSGPDHVFQKSVRADTETRNGQRTKSQTKSTQYTWIVCKNYIELFDQFKAATRFHDLWIRNAATISVGSISECTTRPTRQGPLSFAQMLELHK